MKLERIVTDTKDTLSRVLEALDKRLTLHENVVSIEATVSDTGTADTEFSISHKLGHVPRFYIANLDRAGVVYDSNRTSWTSSTITLKCSAANASIRLTLF